MLILPLAAVLATLQGGKYSQWTLYIVAVSLYLTTTHDSYLIFYYVPFISPILWGMRLLGAVLLLGLVLHTMRCPVTRPGLSPP